MVSLLTTEVHNKALAAYLSEQSGASGNLQMTTATLEVLACIAFRQPISQAEIDLLFDADKRGLVVKSDPEIDISGARGWGLGV